MWFLGADVVVLEANTKGSFGMRGKTIVPSFPHMFEQYKKLAKLGQIDQGSVFLYFPKRMDCAISIIPVCDHFHEIALPEYVEPSLKVLAKWMKEFELASVSMPRIGHGYHRSTWADEIKPIVRDVLKDFEVRVSMQPNTTKYPWKDPRYANGRRWGVLTPRGVRLDIDLDRITKEEREWRKQSASEV